MWFRPCKALICLVFSLAACGDSSSLRLDYQYQGTANLDLILVVGFTPGSASLNWSSDISGLPGFEVFNESQFLEALQGCAKDKGLDEAEDFEVSDPDFADCVAIGEELGDKLFANQEFVLNDSTAALNPDLSLEQDEYLFVLFFYNASDLSVANPRCVQMELAKRDGDQFQIRGRALSNQLEIDVNQPQQNIDCYRL